MEKSTSSFVLASGVLCVVSTYVLLFHTSTGAQLLPQKTSMLEKRSNALDLTVVRVAIGIGIFAVFNVVAITAHHIVQKISRSTRQYKQIEHTVSAF